MIPDRALTSTSARDDAAGLGDASISGHQPLGRSAQSDSTLRQCFAVVVWFLGCGFLGQIHGHVDPDGALQ
jgi:hypothetical protein